jgi:hypothetical protein
VGCWAWLPASSNPERAYRDERDLDRLCDERVLLRDDRELFCDPRRELPERDRALLCVVLRRRDDVEPDLDLLFVVLRRREPLEPERRLELLERELDERVEVRRLRVRPLERWSLGTSARTTARVSCGMRRSR